MSREEIRSVYKQGEEAVVSFIEMLIERLNKLEQEVEALTAQKSKDSHNSSKPPSTDWQKKTKSLRGKSGRKPGGQPGHKGMSLKQVANPDHVCKHPLHGKCQCGRDKADGELLGKEKRQVFDIPPQDVEVTEHQVEMRRCACGEIHTGQFPAGVEAPVQYGPRLRAIILYLSQYQLLPQKRLTQAMADLFGVSASEGTVNTVIQQAYCRLYPAEQAIRAALMAAWVVHGDETGMYVGGKRLWQHTLGTELLTYYYVHANRGRAALRDDATLKKLIAHPRMVVTPHLGANTFEAQTNVAVDVSREILNLLDGKPVENAVNIARFDPDLMAQMRPFMALAEVLGDFISQLAPENPGKVSFSYTGKLAAYDCMPITVAGLAALLNRCTDQEVNMVNANLVAERRGLVVEQSRSTESEFFSNLITLSLETPQGKRTIAGTLFEGTPKIVRMRDFDTDFTPEEHMLVMTYADRPGLIGRIGTILGEAEVNIGAMNLGRRGKGGEAMLVLSVDSPVDEAIVARLNEAVGARFVKAVHLTL